MPVLPTSGDRRPGLRELLKDPLGPTAWQLNYWHRAGYVDDLKGNGTYAAPVDAEAHRHLVEVARLHRAGFKVSDAARLSHEGTVSRSGRRVIPTDEPGVTIIVDPPARIDT